MPNSEIVEEIKGLPFSYKNDSPTNCMSSHKLQAESEQ